MASFSFLKMVFLAGLLAAVPLLGQAQGNYAAEGGEYIISGVLPGEQVYPSSSIKTSGGYLVWQDNITDGAGLGISARKLDSSLSSTLSSFRVNATGAEDQERPSVSMLHDGGAAFVWQGGKQSYQHIYARFLSAAGTWIGEDVMVNTPTNVYQMDPTITALVNSNVVIAWSSYNQASSSSLRDVYFQVFTPMGVKVGTETRVNQITTFNQRSAAIAALSDGRFVVVWISEQQTGENRVDVFARLYTATGSPVASEFLISGTTNICASPSVAASSDGGFAVVWMQKNLDNPVLQSDGWDIYFRPFSANALAGAAKRVNSWTYGDQLGPKISSMQTDYFVTWSSMGQDGSQEGVYGQYLRSDGVSLYDEIQVNTSTLSRQIHPVVASDGVTRFLVTWTGFNNVASGFDVFAQRYANTNQPLAAPGAPVVTVVSSNTLSVSWLIVQGFDIANYEVYVDGAVTPSAMIANDDPTATGYHWTMTGLAPSSSHSFRLAYVLPDGRRSPLSAATSKTTYSASPTWGGIPQEWMMAYFGADLFTWPPPHVDSDGDGVSNRDEFLAGTNPGNAASVLKQNLRPTAQGMFLEWNTMPGLMYQVHATLTPGGAWAPFGGTRFANGTNDSMYVGGGVTRYFRVQRLW